MTIFIAGLTVFDASGQVPDSDSGAVLKAAQASSRLFLSHAEGNRAAYGFEPGDVLSEATLKVPLQLFIIEEKEVLSYRAGQAVEPLLRPTGQWFVPVSVGGTNRAMIEVVRGEDGAWTGSALGMAPLARKWQNIQAWWPEARNFTPRLLVCPPAQGYFLVIPQETKPNLTEFSRISSTLVDGKTAPKPSLQDAEPSLARLRELWRQFHAESEQPPVK